MTRLEQALRDVNEGHGPLYELELRAVRDGERWAFRLLEFLRECAEETNAETPQFRRWHSACK